MGLVKIKSDDEFRWGAEQQQAFDEIKEYLSKPLVLVPPQHDRPFLLKRVVFYLSRCMLDAETR